MGQSPSKSLVDSKSKGRQSVLNYFDPKYTNCDAVPIPEPIPPPAPDSIELAARAATSIPNPGPYEQAAMDGKRLVSLDTFDGMRFDVSKQLSPFMAVVHSFWLGTSMIPDGRNKTYAFISQLATEQGLLFARVDFDRGSVDGRIHCPLLGGLCMGKLQLGLTKGDGQQDQCLAEVDFGGNTWTGNLKYGSVAGGLVFGCNYFQSITPHIALGGEGMYVSANQSLLGNYTLKVNVPTKSSENETLTTGNSESSNSIMCFNFNSSQGLLTMNYKRIVTPNRVTLGAEMSCSPFSLDSQVLVGAEFKLTRSKVSLCVDGEGRIQSVVEAKLGMGSAPTIQFSGELDHPKNVLRFGYGINIEG
jgi:mitochondrial import receptor subunit TOM40